MYSSIYYLSILAILSGPNVDGFSKTSYLYTTGRNAIDSDVSTDKKALLKVETNLKTKNISVSKRLLSVTEGDIVVCNTCPDYNEEDTELDQAEEAFATIGALWSLGGIVPTAALSG